MVRYTIRRLVFSSLLLLAMTLIGFSLFYLLPGDPARLACGRDCSAADVALVARDLGTDRPVLDQYAHFLGALLPVGLRHGLHLKAPDLGHSFVHRRSVDEIVAVSAPETGSLVLGAVVVYLSLAVPLGILSALRRRSLLDRASTALTLLGICAHPVAVGLAASYVFGYRLRLLPIAGYANFFHPLYAQPGGPVQWAYHLLLPWATLAILYAAIYTRMIRANVLDTLDEDYVRTARAKGASEVRVLRAHVLRNALLPVVTMLGMDVGLLLGGAVFVESVYSIEGLGWTLIRSLRSGDSPTVLGILVVATTAIVLVNLLVDLLYAWIDPRIRLT